MTGFRLTSVARERQPTTTTRSTFAGGPITSTSSSDRHGFIDSRPTYYSTRRYDAEGVAFRSTPQRASRASGMLFLGTLPAEPLGPNSKHPTTPPPPPTSTVPIGPQVSKSVGSDKGMG